MTNNHSGFPRSNTSDFSRKFSHSHNNTVSSTYCGGKRYNNHHQKPLLTINPALQRHHQHHHQPQVQQPFLFIYLPINPAVLPQAINNQRACNLNPLVATFNQSTFPRHCQQQQQQNQHQRQTTNNFCMINNR